MVSSAVVPPLERPLQTVVQAAPSPDTWMSNRFCRVVPSWTATLTRVTVAVPPRSRRSQAPSPWPDQRVARLPSTAPAGRLVSLVLAVTADAGGVSSMSSGGGGGGGAL